MSNAVSRLVVAAVGLPLVLGMLWLGGWWLFGLVAVAAFVAVHEFVTTTRPLRPLAPAVYGGVILALVGAKMGGVEWLVAGFLATFVLSFVFHALSSTRAPTTIIASPRRPRSARRSSARPGSGPGSASCFCSARCTRKGVCSRSRSS